jgi:hypothetical protein
LTYITVIILFNACFSGHLCKDINVHKIWGQSQVPEWTETSPGT